MVQYTPFCFAKLKKEIDKIRFTNEVIVTRLKQEQRKKTCLPMDEEAGRRGNALSDKIKREDTMEDIFSDVFNF